MTNFEFYVGRKRRFGTGSVSGTNDHLFEERYRESTRVFKSCAAIDKE